MMNSRIVSCLISMLVEPKCLTVDVNICLIMFCFSMHLCSTKLLTTDTNLMVKPSSSSSIHSITKFRKFSLVLNFWLMSLVFLRVVNIQSRSLFFSLVVSSELISCFTTVSGKISKAIPLSEYNIIFSSLSN